MSAYRHLVEVDGTGVSHHRMYDGGDAADAMAAWSTAITDGAEYVTLESIRRPGPPTQSPAELRGHCAGEHPS